MKDEILNILNAEQVFNKYGIKIKNKMCHCPFHKDSSPSMKVYQNSFYCFSCNRTGDFIEFVKQYFNLNFQEAMEKINYDFNLGLKTRGRIDKKRLEQLQKENELKLLEEKIKKERKNKILITICNRSYIYNKLIKQMRVTITKENWEEIVEPIAFLQEKIELLDWHMDDILKKD